MVFDKKNIVHISMKQNKTVFYYFYKSHKMNVFLYISTTNKIQKNQTSVRENDKEKNGVWR